MDPPGVSWMWRYASHPEMKGDNAHIEGTGLFLESSQVPALHACVPPPICWVLVFKAAWEDAGEQGDVKGSRALFPLLLHRTDKLIF